MQENRKAWPNMLLALFCKKFRNLLPVSFIIHGNRVSRKFSGHKSSSLRLRCLDFFCFILKFFNQFGVTVSGNDLVELRAIVGN